MPSPLKTRTKTDMVIFRENTEDIYAGIEWQAVRGVKKVKFLQEEMGSRRSVSRALGIGIKPVSVEGTAPGPRGDQVRHRQRPQVGDPGAQRATS